MDQRLAQIVANLTEEVSRLRDEVSLLRAQQAQAATQTAVPSVDRRGPGGNVLVGQDHEFTSAVRRAPDGAAVAHASAAPNRRVILGAGASAVAGAVAGTTSSLLAAPTTVLAANGDALTCGQTKTASASTELRYNGGAQVDWNLFTVQDTANAQTNYPSAICAMATSDVSFGVQGYSSVSAAAGVLAYGASGSYGLFARGGRANVLLHNAGTRPTGRADSHESGELVATSSGELWYCTTGGSPGSWRQVCGTATTGALQLLDQSIRVYDSRAGLAPLGVVKGKLNGAERSIDCLFGGDGAEDNSQAVLVNVTVVNTSANGWLAMFRNGDVWPGTSTINWFQSNSVVANLAVVPCSIQAMIRAKVPAGTSTDFVVDLIGFYR